MSRNRLFIVGLMGATALSACSRETAAPAETAAPPAPAVAAPAGPAITYGCESGQTVAVRYPDAATATVGYKGRDYALRLVPSASGARYTGSGLEWWATTRGGQEIATLGRLGPSEEIGVDILERCNRPPATPPAPVQAPVNATPGGVLPASAPCRANQLRLASESGDAGAGNRANVFSITNAGAAACTVAGYPAVSLLDGQRSALSAIRSDQNPNTAMPVNLAVGAKAFFDIAWNVVPHEGAGERVCPSAAQVRVRLHGDTTDLTTPLALTSCGGRIRVNPFRASAEPAPVPAAPTAPST